MSKIRERLQEERSQLQHDMICLEQNDDMLFSNYNGNLPQWKRWRDRIRTLDKQLAKYDKMVKEQRQNDIVDALLGPMGKWIDD